METSPYIWEPSREFVERTQADELIVASQIYDQPARRRSYEIAATLMSEPSVHGDGAATLDEAGSSSAHP